MRIVFSIHHALNPDQGAPGVTYQLWKNFEARGDQSRVLSFTEMPEAVLLKAPTLQQVRFPWFVAHQLHRLEPEYDVADCSSGDAWVYQFTRHDRRMLSVTRSHGLEHIVDAAFREEVEGGRQTKSWKYPLYHGGYRLREVAYSFRSADLAIFPNNADRDYAVQYLGVKRVRTAVVPNGIPSSFVGLPCPSGERSSSGEFRVAVVGSYSHRKINVAPLALNRSLKAHPGLHVGFLGTGVPDEVVLRDYPREFHQRITIVPAFSHAALPGLLANYDVLLFPSLSEGFGLVVYEAMACGLAVIATKLDALQTYLQDGEEVLFVSRNEPDAIEAALGRLMMDAGLRSHLQRNGWRKAQTFAWSTIVEQTAALYEEHLALKRSAKMRDNSPISVLQA